MLTSHDTVYQTLCAQDLCSHALFIKKKKKPPKPNRSVILLSYNLKDTDSSRTQENEHEHSKHAGMRQEVFASALFCVSRQLAKSKHVAFF